MPRLKGGIVTAAERDDTPLGMELARRASQYHLAPSAPSQKNSHHASARDTKLKETERLQTNRGSGRDNTIQHSTAQHSTVRYGTVQCSAVQCSAVQCIALHCIASSHFVPRSLRNFCFCLCTVIELIVVNRVCGSDQSN